MSAFSVTLIMKLAPLQLSFRVWLFLLAILTVLPITWFAASTLMELSNKSRDETLVRLESRTSDVVFKLDTLLQSSISALNALGQTDAAQRGDFATLYESAKRVLQTNAAFRAITLIDAQGQMQFLTAAPYGAQGFPVSYVHLIEEAIKTGQPNVSGPFVTAVSDNKLIAISVPVYRSGRITHVLRMIVLAEKVSQILIQSGLPPGWIAGVVDREGVLLARNIDADKYAGKRGTQAVLDAMQRKERFQFQTLSLDGAPVTTMIAPVHNADWFLGVAVPNELLNAPARENMKHFVGVGVIGLLLSLLVAHLMARFLSKQTSTLAQILSGADPSNNVGLKLHVTDLSRILNSHLSVINAENEAHQKMETVSQQLNAAVDWFENAPCGYHLMDGEGRILKMNRIELRWFGYSLQEVVGRHISEFLTEDSRQSFAECYPKLAQQGYVNDIELEFLAKDGTQRTRLIAASAVRSDQGQVIEIRSALFDITERKQFEKNLIQAHAQLQARREFLENTLNGHTSQSENP